MGKKKEDEAAATTMTAADPAAPAAPVAEANPAEKVDPKPAEKAAEKPAEKPVDKPAEKTTEAPVAPAAPAAPVAAATPVASSTEKPAEKSATTSTVTPGDNASPKVPPVQTPSQVLSAFHDLLAGLGLTAKDFFGAMAQKSLESMGDGLTGTVTKAVEASLTTLQNGVKAVEKSVKDAEKSVKDVEKSVDAKLAEVTKDFSATIAKLSGRLEKVEQVGGVPNGASGQEGTPETTDRSSGKFVGIFSRALRNR